MYMHESHLNESAIQTEIPSRNYANCKKRIELALHLRLSKAKDSEPPMPEGLRFSRCILLVRATSPFCLLQLKKH